MQTERAEGIVLRVQPVTETSLLVTWFTREAGKLKTLAKGARRPKSPMRGKIDLFYEDEIVFLRSKRSDLHLLHECFLEDPRPKLRNSLAQLAAASFACELVDALTVVEDPSPPVFEALRATLGMLAERADAVPLVWMELRLLDAGGWLPAFDAGSGTEKLLRSLSDTSAAGVARVRLSAGQAQAAQDTLAQLRQPHLSRPLRTLRMLAGKIER